LCFVKVEFDPNGVKRSADWVFPKTNMRSFLND